MWLNHGKTNKTKYNYVIIASEILYMQVQMASNPRVLIPLIETLWNIITQQHF